MNGYICLKIRQKSYYEHKRVWIVLTSRLKGLSFFPKDLFRQLFSIVDGAWCVIWMKTVFDDDLSQVRKWCFELYLSVWNCIEVSGIVLKCLELYLSVLNCIEVF